MTLNNSKYTLLFISPVSNITEEIQDLLQQAGFHLLIANDFLSGIELLNQKTPDLILSDIDAVFPFPSSIRREFQFNSKPGDIPVLLFISPGQEEVISQHIFFPSVSFILKPLNKKELVIRIRHQLLLSRTYHLLCRQNEKLKKALESRNKLYSVIAHDLRAPIGTIKMINTTIETHQEKITDPKIRKLFQMLNETTEEAFNLLENLLRWSRNQNGQTKLYQTSFNINRTICQVISLFTTLAQTKGIQLYNHLSENISVYADEDMVKTILRNLISNAIKFTYSGGRIDIDATPLEEEILISIKDNGKGIPKNIRDKLLKSNEYITTYGTHNEKGSGLGLHLSQEFVKMNKGKIWLTSLEGVGTTFFFTLPTSSPATHSPAASC